MAVWSLAHRKEVYRAKGGKPNRVGLVDLPHVTAVAFLPAAAAAPPGPAGAEPEEAGPPPLRLLAGTAKHKLWLYDLAAGKRPQLEVAWGETRVTALAPEPDGEPCQAGCDRKNGGSGVHERGRWAHG